MATRSKKFAVGDWVIQGFEMKQIKEIRDSWYTVSDGSFETSGNLQDYMRPATYQTKRIADLCRYYYKDLYAKFDRAIQNWPDLNRWFDARCIEMIDVMDDEKALTALADDMQAFYNAIVQDCESRRDTRIRGLSLYTR